MIDLYDPFVNLQMALRYEMRIYPRYRTVRYENHFLRMTEYHLNHANRYIFFSPPWRKSFFRALKESFLSGWHYALNDSYKYRTDTMGIIRDVML